MTADPSTQFCLKWNNYPESLAGSLSEFLAREAFLDVSLACEDAVISAHKCVLSACSPFFQEILLKNPCSHPTVVLPAGLRAADVSRLVSFIYHGEVNVPHHQLPELIRAAELLQIRGLTSDSLQALRQPLQLQQQTAQPLEVRAVVTLPEPPPPQLTAPPPAAVPATPRRKRRRPDGRDSPPLTAAAEPPPPPLPPPHLTPAALPQQDGLQSRGPAAPPTSAGHDPRRATAAGPGLAPAPPPPPAEPPRRCDRLPPPDATPKQEPPERCRSPALQPLQPLDGLDMLDPAQLLGYDGSAGGPSTHRPCPVCSRIMRKRDLSRHVQRVHSERKHACGLCSLSYGYRLDLRRHLQEKHPALVGRESPLSAGSANQEGSDSEEASDCN